MLWKILTIVVLLATPSLAQNLLQNPDFDLDPTIPGNGWDIIGTGIFEWLPNDGYPAAPSVAMDQVADESMILCQCAPVVGGEEYNFSSYSYTPSSYGGATNGVYLSTYSTPDCSGIPIETVKADQASAPDWYFRERVGYIVPGSAMSAKIELRSVANGGRNNICWDHVVLERQLVPVKNNSWGNVKALYR